MSSNEEINNTFTEVINPRILKRKTIDSFSIICYTIIDNKIHYLLGRVRDTIPFKEFIRGNITDTDMPKYMTNMSKEEKYRILTESFQDLIDDIFINHSSKSYRTANNCKEEFEIYKQHHLNLLLNTSIGLYEQPWIFPKGRKNEHEQEHQCALREFEEETRIPASLITLCEDFEPLEEIYTGLDGKFYKTVYFVGSINYDDFKNVSPFIRSQFIYTNKRITLSDEISKIKWLEYSNAIDKLDKTKQYILRLVNTILIFSLEIVAPKRRNSIT